MRFTAAPLLIRLYSRMLRWLPLASGVTRLAFNPIVNRLFARVSGMLVARMLDGTRIAVDPADYDGRVLYLFGTNDPKVHHVVQAMLRRGDRFLDIGANYSSIGLLAADRVGQDGQIHLFEPQPHLCEAVRGAIEDKKRSNVHLHEVGLMDRDDELRLARPRHHSGMATFVTYRDQSNWIAQSVPVKNVATYLPPLIDSKPFGVKIDVEGAEVYLMPWLLNQSNIKFIVFEAAHNHRQLWDTVNHSGMVIYGLVRAVFAKKLRRVATFEQMGAYHDLVAIRLPNGAGAPEIVGTYEFGRTVRGVG